jgi:hypothetical protein
MLFEMSSSSFINALRRITAIRGPIKIFRSDRGTNFIGATDQIGIKSINVEDTKVKQHLDNTGSVWRSSGKSAIFWTSTLPRSLRHNTQVLMSVEMSLLVPMIQKPFERISPSVIFLPIIFTCLTIRAVHIELIEEMSSSSFINALRRITAIRGPIKIFRSDRGTNFIGATDVYHS